MGRICAFLTLLCLVLQPAAALAGPRVMRVGVFHHPPYMIVENGEISGTDVDLARLVLERAGYGVAFLVRPPARGIREVVTGELDVLPGIGLTPDRERILWYGSPIHAKMSQVFVRASDAARIGSPEALLELGRPVGFIRGFRFGRRLDGLREVLREKGLAEEEADIADNIRKLLAGRIIAFVDMRDPGLHEIEKMGLSGEVVPLGEPEFMGWAYLALSRKTCTPADLERVEQALAALRREGLVPPLEFAEKAGR